MTELYKKYRPRKFADVVGQPGACRMLTRLVKKKKIPHCILFTGPSGCGKTTLARIVKTKLACADVDYMEVNAAEKRGIDDVRNILRTHKLAPLGGANRIIYLDEAHHLTTDAQTALLKVLEDTPGHVYFILATTHPQKLINTIKTRSTEIKVNSLNNKQIQELLVNVLMAEGRMVSEEVQDKIADVAEGSARKALVLLEQVLDIEEEEDQINALESADQKRQSIEIARALLNPRSKWTDMTKIIKGVDEDAEGLRRMVLGYATSVMLGSKVVLHPRANLIIQVFRDHWYDCGKAGLVACCWEVMSVKSRK